VSNSNIVARLKALADGLECGDVSVSELARQLNGHASALDRMEYRRIKEAQMVGAQLQMAVEERREHDVDRNALLTWLHKWIESVPVDPA
jgi:transposase-like protein